MPTYRCSNGHVFQSVEEPIECPMEGCESRFFGPSLSLSPGQISTTSGITIFSVFFWATLLFLQLATFLWQVLHWGPWMWGRVDLFWHTVPFDLAKVFFPWNSTMIPIVLALCCYITAWIVGLVKIYRAWKAIQPLRQENPGDSTMPTPGSAIGFLFIPFFNLYWLFVSFVGLTHRANRLCQLRGIAAEPMKSGISIATCILMLLPVWYFPYIGWVAFLAHLILIYLFVFDVNRMTNFIRQSEIR